MIDVPNDVHTYDLPDLTTFVARYLEQIITGLGYSWVVTSRKRLREERLTPSDEVFVRWPFNTIILGDVCACDHQRDEIRQRDLISAVKGMSSNTSRYYRFAFSSYSRKDSVEIEFLQIDPDGSLETMGGRALKFTDQEENSSGYFWEMVMST